MRVIEGVGGDGDFTCIVTADYSDRVWTKWPDQSMKSEFGVLTSDLVRFLLLLVCLVRFTVDTLKRVIVVSISELEKSRYERIDCRRERSGCSTLKVVSRCPSFLAVEERLNELLRIDDSAASVPFVCLDKLANDPFLQSMRALVPNRILNEIDKSLLRYLLRSDLLVSGFLSLLLRRFREIYRTKARSVKLDK